MAEYFPFDVSFKSFSGSFSGSFFGNGSGVTGVSAAPAGANKAIQFNDNGKSNGSGNFTFDQSIKSLTLTGSLNVSGSTTQIGNNTLLGNTLLSGSLTVSGSQPGTATNINIYGDTSLYGSIKFLPVIENIDTTVSASYIYVSGSTQDLYFSQNGSGYTNVTRLRWLEGTLYTGLLHGGLIGSSSSTVYTISSGSGIIVNLNASFNNDPYPTIKFVTWGTLSASIAPLSASFDQTFVAINNSGTITTQGIPFSDGQFDTLIPIGLVLHQNHSTINGVKTKPSLAYGWKQRSNVFVEAFGPLKLSGYNLAVSSSSTGSLTVGSGTAFADGANYSVDPNNPSYASDSGTTVSKIFRYWQSGSDWVYDTNGGAGYGAINPGVYASQSAGGAVLTAVPGTGANREYSIQRCYWYPNSATKAIVVYYGNATYATQTDAAANIQFETFTEAPNTAANAVYLGALIVRNNANFTNSTSYVIERGGLFRAVGGGGGGGSTTPGGSNTQIQFNNGGGFGGSPNFTFNGSNVGITGSLVVSGAYGLDTSLATLSRNGVTKLDWANSVLNDTSGLNSVLWETRELTNTSETATVNWEDAALYDNNALPSIDWNARFLYDSAGNRSYNYDARALIYPNGSTPALNYGTQDQISMTGSVSVTGSLTVSGSSTFTNIGPAVFSGSVDSQGGFTGSLQGTASFATTASYLNNLNQNLALTGSLTITNNLTVLGSASITYVSQSTLNIGTNLITVNTNTPATRFGGLAVIDSGSSPQVSGSILFDSTNNQWIFTHQNTGGAITSSVFIQGPQTYNNVGNETNLTNNRLPKSVNAEHIGDSNITDTGTVVSINSNTQLTGSLSLSSSNYIRFNNTGSGTNTNYSDLSVYRYSTYDTPALKLIRPDGIGFNLYRQGSTSGVWLGDENGNRNMTMYSNAFGAFTFSAPGSGGDFSFTGGDATTPAYASSIVFRTNDYTINAVTSSDHSVKIQGPNVTGSNPYNLVSFQVGSAFTEKAAIRYDGGAYFSSSVSIGLNASASSLHVRGAGSTSATSALRVESLSTSSSLTFLNNGNTIITGSITLTSGVSASAGALGNGIEIYGRNLGTFANNPGLATFWAGDFSYLTSSIVGMTFGNQNSGNHRAAIVYESTGRSLNFYTNALNFSGQISYGSWLLSSTAATLLAKLHVRSDGTSSSATKAFHVENTSSLPLFVVLDNGFVGINTGSAQFNLDVNGTARVSSSLIIGTSSAGSTENTIVVGVPPAGGTGEGGQILLQASGGLYTSASMIDNYQNQFRVLRGTNAGSDGFKLSVNMHTGQVQIPNYNSATAFTGSSVVAGLGVDSNGNILTNTRLAKYGTAISGSTIGTGVTAQTIVYQQLIPANTFSAGNMFRTYYRFRKLSTNANATHNILVNTTSGSVAGATTIALLTANTVLNGMKRDFYISQGSTTTFLSSGVSNSTDDATGVMGTSVINWAVDQYLMYTVTLGTLDSGYGIGYTIEQIL
jgi:hypothetical protein